VLLMNENGNSFLTDVYDKNCNSRIISDDPMLCDQYTKFFHVLHKKKIEMH